MKTNFFILLATVILMAGNASGQSMVGVQPAEVLDSIITWKFSGATDSVLAYRTVYQYDTQQRMTQSEEFVREQALNMWVPYRKENWQFDGQGRQTLWAVLFWENEYLAYKGLFRNRYVFDDHGNISESYYDGWSLSPFDWINYKRTLNYYDSENRLTNEVNFEWNSLTQTWDSTEFSVLEYNTEGLLERKTGWEPEEGSGVFYPKLRFDYEYNSVGDMILGIRFFYNHNTQLWYYMVKMEHAYDAFHREISSWYWKYEESIEAWVPQEKYHWDWDEAGNMTLYEYYRIGEDTVTWMPSSKSEMVYNSYNKMLKNTGYSGNDQGEWEAGYMREYEYLQDTLLIEDALSQWDAGSASWLGVDTHEYTFDTLSRRLTDSYSKWIVHVQQFVLSTREFYFYSRVSPHDVAETVNPGFKLWPNPAHNQLIVSFNPNVGDICLIGIFDSYGKKISSSGIFSKTEGKIFMDISDLPCGIYHIRIAASKFSKSLKFLKT